MRKLRILLPKKSVGRICALFGKTRQAYYQRQEYQYQEQAEEGIILDLIADVRKLMGRVGGRKLQRYLNQRLPADMQIGRDKLFDIMDRHHLKVHKKRRIARTTWSESWLHRFPNLIKDLVLTASNPRDNAIAERVNGILKNEWLYDNHFIGLKDAIIRVAEVINLYNNYRIHLSLDYKTPAQAYAETGEQKRRWK